MHYKGFEISRGRTYQDWWVFFPALNRTRWGTLAEIKSDIDAVVSGVGLPSIRHGGN